MIYLVLLIVCFYVSTCIGVYMKSSIIPMYHVEIGWIIVFPLIYIYLFITLLFRKDIKSSKVINSFASSIGIHALLYAIKQTECDIKNGTKKINNQKHYKSKGIFILRETKKAIIKAIA